MTLKLIWKLSKALDESYNRLISPVTNQWHYLWIDSLCMAWWSGMLRGRGPNNDSTCKPFDVQAFSGWKLSVEAFRWKAFISAVQLLQHATQYWSSRYCLNWNFNWNLYKLPICLGLAFSQQNIISRHGVTCRCQKINFNDSKSGITQSFNDVMEFHLSLLPRVKKRNSITDFLDVCLLCAFSIPSRTIEKIFFPLKRLV